MTPAHASLDTPNWHNIAQTRSSLPVDPVTGSADSFLQGNTISYVEEMYRSWQDDPQSVHVSWRAYFRNINDDSVPISEALALPPSLVSSRHKLDRSVSDILLRPESQKEVKHLKVQQLVRAYQSHGHRHATLDPLGLQSVPEIGQSQQLNPDFYTLTKADMSLEFDLSSDLLPNFLTAERKSMRLKDILMICKKLYCSTYGIETDHITDSARREWLRSRLEVPKPINFSRPEKGRMLDELIRATALENLLAQKTPHEKRFGLDGAESVAPAVTALMDRSADSHGVKEIIIGSCHRGRLTLAGTAYGKPFEAIFAEFSGRTSSNLLPNMTSDVRSHLGWDGSRTTPNGRQIALSLLANPSHLEAVDPVATGKAYAVQKLVNDSAKREVMCLALHGDAAIAGQGVVYETLNMSKIPAYDVGGTVRLVINNQIGFTTNPNCSRSNSYCSDIAKLVGAPIFHVNADDVEAVTFLCQLAADWRATFHTDCVIDIVCYRKFGHQELDLPNVTQPLMYQKIGTHKSPLDQYITRLVAERTFTEQEIDLRRKQISDHLDNKYLESKHYAATAQPHPRRWHGLATPEENSSISLAPQSTAIQKHTVKTILEKITTVPDDFTVHKSLQRMLTARKKGSEDGSIDWSTAEALAFGSLCLEGFPVRITGQDVQRGTFAQRHAVIHDQGTGSAWTALNSLSNEQAQFSALNSPLSEYGPLGFEYGYSLADPRSLVMWEAQFGDFVNTAQVVVDNFIANAEFKWMDRSGIVLSLPHGSDGQGPEHSSARLERFLMLCNGRTAPTDIDRQHQDCNMQVVCITSPANYFHVIRRQLRRQYRKPLIMLFSKSLLRNPLTISSIDEFIGTSGFRPVIADPEHGRSIEMPRNIKRLMFCTGQVYAALQKHREIMGIEDVAITRVEEIHPFPWKEVQEHLEKYPNVQEVIWAQEEPYNGGAWHFVRDRLTNVLENSKAHRDLRLKYVGMPVNATTAPGLKSQHEGQVRRFLEDAFPVTNQASSSEHFRQI